MSHTWTREDAPTWTADKERIIGGAAPGIFDVERLRSAGALPGTWWRAEDQSGAVIGYGWMDVVWGDGEILVAVDQERSGQGIGTWMMEQLAQNAVDQGLAYMRNTVPEAHPQAPAVKGWLEACGFVRSTSPGEYVRQVRGQVVQAA